MPNEQRRPTDRPYWVGDAQGYPCGRCGKDTEYQELHDCPDVCTKCKVDHSEE